MSQKVAARPRTPKPADITELDLIRGLRFQQWQMQEELYQAVADARSARFTWRAIGEALEITAQSAHKRFGPSRVDQ